MTSALRVLLAASLVASIAQSSPLEVDIDESGFLTLSVDGTMWLSSREVAVHVQGTWYSVAEGNMKPASLIHYNGTDSIGDYMGTTMTWAGTSGVLPFSTSLRVYPEEAVAVFGQSFPGGAQGTALREDPNECYDNVMSAFPAWSVPTSEAQRGSAPELGFMTYAGNMACGGAGLICTFAGAWNASMPNTFPPASEAGGPVVLFTAEGDRALVLSPLSEFMTNSYTLTTGATGELQLRGGVMGSVASIPDGYTIETVAVLVSGGFNAAIPRLGSLLRSRYGKGAQRDGDVTVNYLGYYTDNGAYYYYLTEPNRTYEQTLVDVASYASSAGLPYRYYQLDSWWYYKGVAGGVKTWEARPDVFPDGLAGLHAKLQTPLVAHNRYWAADTTYARANGGDYDFTIEGATAIPLEQRFWDDLMRNYSAVGGRVYEQDWLDTEFQRMNVTRTSATLARQWLLQMGRGADRNGLTIQYCMPWPRHVMQSVELPAVTQVRVSDDYHPNNDQWSIGASALLAHSLGLGPFKDDFWTTTTEPGNPYGTTTEETAPALETVSAALSMGPVGPSDRIGSTNTSLLMRCCRTDGLILKPDRPITLIDATFQRRALGTAGPDGVLMHTWSQPPGASPHFIVLAGHLDAPYTLTAGDLGMPAQVQWVRYPSPLSTLSDGQSAQPVAAGSTAQIQLPFPALNKTAFQLWHFAAVGPSNWALLGEVDKIVPVSAQRFTWVRHSDQGLEAQLAGAVGETIQVFAAHSTAPSSPVAATCKFGPSGSAVLRVPAMTCA